jgi:hypothetical protein
MERTDLMDTSEWAHRALVERLRQLTPEERARMTFERIKAMRALRKRTSHLRPEPRRS